jgi:threonine synthase
MGLPIKLIASVNENDIISKFIESGIFEIGNISKTISPSMDIQSKISTFINKSPL